MFGRGGCGVLGALGWELASERVDWVAGVLWVLWHVKEGELGRCVGLATVAARWRPQSSSGCVAREGGVQREGKWVQGFAEVPREAVGEAGGGLRPLTAAAAPLSTGGGEAERQRGRR